MIKKVGEFDFPRVLDDLRLMRRGDDGANWSKRVNLASKRTRVENDMEPLRILFFSNNLVSTAMTLVSTMKVNVFYDLLIAKFIAEVEILPATHRTELFSALTSRISNI